MWTDDYRKNSFLTITCHYITPDFLLRSRVLTTAMFPPEETKTGDNIRRELQHQLVSVLGFDACVMNKVVWVTDQGSNMIAALTQYHRLDCQDHVYNTVLRRALDCDELRDCAPEITQTLLAAKTLVRYVKQTGIINQLTKTVRQMSDTRFSTVFLTLDSIKEVYTELREKLDNRRESRRIDEVSPDVLEFLLDFLRPFYQAQRELEGDQYPTLNLVVLWHERLKRHCLWLQTVHTRPLFVTDISNGWIAKSKSRHCINLPYFCGQNSVNFACCLNLKGRISTKNPGVG